MISNNWQFQNLDLKQKARAGCDVPPALRGRGRQIWGQGQCGPRIIIWLFGEEKNKQIKTSMNLQRKFLLGNVAEIKFH